MKKEKSSKVAKTKFIATVAESKIEQTDEIAQTLKKDGVKVDKVSPLFGIICGKSEASLKELKTKYESKGVTIEPDRDVSI